MDYISYDINSPDFSWTVVGQRAYADAGGIGGGGSVPSPFWCDYLNGVWMGSTFSPECHIVSPDSAAYLPSIVSAGDTLDIDHGINPPAKLVIENGGQLDNYGSLNFGRSDGVVSGVIIQIEEGGILNNYGTINNYNVVVENKGTLQNHLVLNNYRIIHNRGAIKNIDEGEIYNYGTLNNYNTIDDIGGRIINSGTLLNYDGAAINNYDTGDTTGSIINKAGGSITNENGGAINNESGIIKNSGVFDNYGTLTGGHITNEGGGSLNNRNTGRINNYGIGNSGNINNDGIIDNYGGGIFNLAGGTINNANIINNHNVDFHVRIDNRGNLNNNYGGIINNYGEIYNNFGGMLTNNAGASINNYYGMITDRAINNQGSIYDYCSFFIGFSGITIIDKCGPTTSFNLSGAAGNDEWFLSDVQVTLQASDASGIRTIFYSTNNVNWNVYSSPFTVSTEGQNTIYFYSMDSNGNTESPKSGIVKIDKTAPNFELSTPQDGQIVGTTMVEFGGPLNDPISGVKRIQLYFDGVLFTDGHPGIQFNAPHPTPLPWSIIFAHLSEPGIHTFGARVTDRAGNAGPLHTVTFIVPSVSGLDSSIATNEESGSTVITGQDSQGNMVTQIILPPGTTASDAVNISYSRLKGIEADSITQVSGLELPQPYNAANSKTLMTLTSGSPTSTCIIDSAEQVYVSSLSSLCDSTDTSNSVVILACDGIDHTYTGFPSGTPDPRTYSCTIVSQNGLTYAKITGLAHSTTIIDTTPPTGTVVINSGATYATSNEVVLMITCEDGTTGCAGMAIAPDGINFGSFMPFAESTTITLPAGDGAKTVAVKFKDAAGNISEPASATIILDAQGPAITLLIPGPIVREATGSLTSIDLGSATAVDVIDGEVHVTNDAPGSFPIGTTIVTYTAIDSHGNKATVTQSIVVTDITPPALTVPQEDIVVLPSSPSGATVTFSSTATDIVDGSVATTCSPASGSTFAIGTTTVVCTATDAHGNKASSSFKVIVLTPLQAVQKLADRMHGMDLDKDTTNSLDVKLNSAYQSLGSGNNIAAKNQLSAFIKEVNAQSGKKITAAQANELVSTAQNIVNSIQK